MSYSDPPPPPHPQPGFYEQLVEEQGYNPAQAEMFSHANHMALRNQQGWLGALLLDFDKRTGKFDQTRHLKEAPNKSASAKKGRAQ